jgi:dTDP-4-amino-4,6-dideoxygalactose transaminase
LKGRKKLELKMTDRKRIPFLDLVAPHQQLKAELQGVFDAVLGSAGFIGGPMVEGFEREFAAFCDARECVGVGSGTDALRFALMAAGIGQGQIVVTVPNTFIATTEAITQAGARPEFVDIDAQTYNMDPRKLQEFLETACEKNSAGALVHRKSGMRVTAVVPVHLYGQMADMDAILELAERYGLAVIEDACQAHGAEYFSKKEGRWKKAGSMGRAAAFSFYPGKNLGACGEAGAVTTNEAGLAHTVRMLRDHGQTRKYYHEIGGYNGRLDAMQAGILKIKLQRLKEWNESRRRNARRYRELLEPTGLVGLPAEASWAKVVYHLFVVRVASRDELQAHLAVAEIGTGIHYPVPLHLQNAYRALGYRLGDFPVTEKAATEIVSLPMYPGLSNEDIGIVCEQVHAFSRTVDGGRSVVVAGSGD